MKNQKLFWIFMVLVLGLTACGTASPQPAIQVVEAVEQPADTEIVAPNLTLLIGSREIHVSNWKQEKITNNSLIISKQILNPDAGFSAFVIEENCSWPVKISSDKKVVTINNLYADGILKTYSDKLQYTIHLVDTTQPDLLKVGFYNDQQFEIAFDEVSDDNPTYFTIPVDSTPLLKVSITNYLGKGFYITVSRYIQTPSSLISTYGKTDFIPFEYFDGKKIIINIPEGTYEGPPLIPYPHEGHEGGASQTVFQSDMK